MLDAQPAKLTRIGKVTITAEGVVVKNFEAANGSCRDVAALATLWAIGKLQRELMALLEQPGGGRIGLG